MLTRIQELLTRLSGWLKEKTYEAAEMLFISMTMGAAAGVSLTLTGYAMAKSAGEPLLPLWLWNESSMTLIVLVGMMAGVILGTIIGMVASLMNCPGWIVGIGGFLSLNITLLVSLAMAGLVITIGSSTLLAIAVIVMGAIAIKKLRRVRTTLLVPRV